MAITDAYLGNPNLKKVNTPVSFTKEQIVEYQKCANDPIYFMETYMQIVSLDEGLVPFKMYDFLQSRSRTGGVAKIKFRILAHVARTFFCAPRNAWG